MKTFKEKVEELLTKCRKHNNLILKCKSGIYTQEQFLKDVVKLYEKYKVLDTDVCPRCSGQGDLWKNFIEGENSHQDLVKCDFCKGRGIVSKIVSEKYKSELNDNLPF